MPLITHSIAISADRDTTPDELTHWQANPAEFVFTLADGEDFTDVDSVSLELRKMGQTGAAGLLARATASGMADVDTEVTLSFTSAEMNQTVTAEYHTLFLWLYATSTDTHTTLWKGTVKLYADETTASLTEQPPDVESWNLTEASAAALYATLTSLDALDTRVTALEDGGTEVWGGITGTLSSQTDLNTALGLKANTASLGTLATQSGTFSGSGTLATGGFTLTVPATGTAALAGTYSNSALNATTIGATTPGTGAFTTLTASSTLAVTGASTMAAITSTQLALGTVTADGVLITNTTNAATGAQQYSPSMSLSGDGFSTGGGRMPVKFSQYVVPVQGSSSPTGLLTWDSKVGTAAAVVRMTLDTAGALAGLTSVSAALYYGSGTIGGLLRMDGNTSARGLGIGSFAQIAWASGSFTGGSVSGDTSLSRNAAGIVQIGTTTTNALGSLLLTNLTASGTITATPNTLTGPGAISISTTTTGYISTGGAQSLGLADGQNGQIKTIIHTSDGGSGELTPTTKSGYTKITFTNVGDSVTLQFITGTGWCIIGIYGAVAA